VSSIARVYVTRRAQRQIETAVRWWSQNRPSAPNAIVEELDKALEILIVQPNIGARAKNANLPGVRRVTLTRVSYYLYYTVRGDALEVLAFWHTSRAPAREL